MKVSFYGHVRQYENIKAEIDAKMNEVIMSGSYVLGPMGKKFDLCNSQPSTNKQIPFFD